MSQLPPPPGAISIPRSSRPDSNYSAFGEPVVEGRFTRQAGVGLREAMGKIRGVKRETLRQASGRTPEFMPAKEVMRKYAPLPGDYDDQDLERTHTTGGGSATYQIHGLGVRRRKGPGSWPVPRIPGAPSRPKAMPGDTGEHWYTSPQTRTYTESKNELWDRKLEEAETIPNEEGLTLADRIEEHGRVLNPIQLSTRRVARDDGTESAGQRFILGGHHRLAVAASLGYEVPVLHYHETRPHFDDPEYPYEGKPISTPEDIRDRHDEYDRWEKAAGLRQEARRQQRASRKRGRKAA